MVSKQSDASSTMSQLGDLFIHEWEHCFLRSGKYSILTQAQYEQISGIIHFSDTFFTASQMSAWCYF